VIVSSAGVDSGKHGDAIDRREAIRRAAMLLGGALSASTVAAAVAACERASAPAGVWKPRAFDLHDADLVAAIAEHILPQTDTPGARAAQVDRFIDSVVADYHTPAERDAFIAGLRDVDARAREEHGAAFLDCDAARQHALLAAMDRDAFPRDHGGRAGAADVSRETERGGGGIPAIATARSDTQRKAASSKSPRPFMRTMKELTVVGYYTSELGAKQELRYARVPGRFDGCVPLSASDRAWAV